MSASKLFCSTQLDAAILMSKHTRTPNLLVVKAFTFWHLVPTRPEIFSLGQTSSMKNLQNVAGISYDYQMLKDGTFSYKNLDSVQ